MAAKKKAAKAKARKKAPARKTATRKTTVKKAPAKKAATKKAASKKTATKKSTAKKATSRKAVAKKVVAKKSVAKKATAKKAAPKKAAGKAATKKTTRKIPARKASPKKSAPQKTPAAKTPRAGSSPAAPIGPVPGIAPYVEKKGEEYMNEAQVEHFRNILNAWKRELMEEVDRTVHHMQDEAANFPDPNDRATQESEFSMELRTRDRERKLIKKIDEALLHLDNDEYGYCEDCGIEIGIRRLEARPTATLCIDCKTLHEIKEKQRG
ncbi:MAG TPA: RNA polymerase-binding protein DksA [Gammaproteobacteria bacterium]|nr:RNA polymerase-binding protein DksA [Gammaproteobacteria bacterium]